MTQPQLQYMLLHAGFRYALVSNCQGSNLGRVVTPARTSGLSSTQGMVRERALKVS